MQRITGILATWTTLAAITAVAAPAAQAQSIKPGVWETSSKVSSADIQTSQTLDMAMQQLGNLPAAQRAQMEAFLAKNGVSAPKVGSDGAITLRGCVTPEMAAKKELPLHQKGQCTSSSTPAAGGLDVTFSCQQPASSGRGQVRFSDDSHYTMVMDVTTSATGTPQDVKVNSTGRWVAATCPARP
ncbi:MAG: DUF3617 domain-containing protein [Duganella sp.]